MTASLQAPDAVVFPGQGSQVKGMGADFHQRFAVARNAFEEAGDAVGVDLGRICFDGDERLHLTEFTQPCVLTMEIAAYRVAVEEFGLTAGVFGGHSLGEYTALVAAGALPFADAVRLVRMRGALMQQAVPEGQGAMAALLHDDIERTEAAGLAIAAGAEVANINSTEQIVISGTAESLERAKQRLTQALPGLTYIPLRVSAPFHSGLMRTAEETFGAELAPFAARIRTERAEVVTSNRTGGFHTPETLLDNLVLQITGPVRWLDNMRAIADRAGRIHEIGPRAALTKFFRTLGRDVLPVTKVAQAEGTAPGRNGLAPLTTVPLAPRGVAVSLPSPPSADGGGGRAELLGSAAFRRAHGTSLAYAAGGMRLGISSPALVLRLARAGLLGYLGTAGVPLGRIERDVRTVQAELAGDAPWGVNVSHDMHAPERTAHLFDLLLRAGVTRIETMGFSGIEPALVRYRLTGARMGEDGLPKLAGRVLAKVSRPDIAPHFLAPPPEPVVRRLREQRLLSAEEALVAPMVTMADDLCAEGDGGGRGAGVTGFTLLPMFLRERDETALGRPRGPRVRVGVAGGIGTPEAVAAAFTMGADFVLTGSVNQCTPEAGTSDTAKEMLAAADIGDFAQAPDGDLFELGAKVPVLRKGVFFPARADKLYDYYLRYGDLEEIATAQREQIEREYFKKSYEEVQAEILTLAPAPADRAAWERQTGRPRMARIFGWYLADTLRRACAGEGADRLNFQIQSGPALGAFNHAVRNTSLSEWRNRHVDEVARFLMGQAARIMDERWRHAGPARARVPDRPAPVASAG